MVQSNPRLVHLCLGRTRPQSQIWSWTILDHGLRTGPKTVIIYIKSNFLIFYQSQTGPVQSGLFKQIFFIGNTKKQFFIGSTKAIFYQSQTSPIGLGLIF